MRFRLVAICWFCALATPWVPVSAFEANVQTTPELNSTDQCRVEPLADVDLVAIVEKATPTTTANATPVVTGPAAEPETVDAVTRLIQESIACTNANDPMRAFALFTDGYLQRRFGGANQDDLGHLLAALTRSPAAAAERDRLILVSVERVIELPDGRVAATVTTANATTDFVDTLLFEVVDGRWLIDAVIQDESGSPATSASSSALQRDRHHLGWWRAQHD